eukprot:403376932
MKNLQQVKVLCLILGLQFIDQTLAEDKLAYVFQLIRHGARAPLVETEPWIFKVPTGHLTAEGMRQRYLMGQFNRQRFIQVQDQMQSDSNLGESINQGSNKGFLDDEYNPNQIYVQSTTVPRAVQSTYSELLGLYPPKGSKLTEGENQSLISGKGQPKLKLRNLQQNTEDLDSLHSTIDGLTIIPNFNYLTYNPLMFDSCPYVDDRFDYYYSKKAEETFADVSSYILPIVKKSLGKSQGFNDTQINALTFKDCYRIQDQIKAEQFEGRNHTFHFTNEVWANSRNIQKWILTLPQGDEGRALLQTKAMEFPLKVMSDRLQSIIKQKDDLKRDELKYVIYSGHDDQIANLLMWLDPYHYEFLDVPYTSNVYFELHYDDECLTQVGDESCFSVHVIHEGRPLSFDTCLDGNIKRNSKSKNCSYTDFIEHINKIKYQGDTHFKCLEQFVPPTL